MSDDAAVLGDALVPVMATSTGLAGLAIEGLARLSGGASRETWSFDAVEPSGVRHPLILQCTRSLVVDAWVDTATEAQLIRSARKTGVPVPDLVAWSADPGALGMPYIIVERLDGETIPQRILRDDRFCMIASGAASQPMRRPGAIVFEKLPSRIVFCGR